MRVGNLCALVLLSLLGLRLAPGRVLADRPLLRDRPQSDRLAAEERPDAQGTLRAQKGGLQLAPLRQEDIDLAKMLLAAPGNGGGGDVEADSLLLIQDFFVEDEASACGFPDACNGGPCNVVLMLWNENTPNPDGVTIIVDGECLPDPLNPAECATIPGLDPAQLPGINGVNIIGVDAGLHSFRVEEGEGTGDECEITVRDDKPFADPINVQCQGVGQDATRDCKMLVSWEKGSGPGPEVWLVLVDGFTIGQFTPGALLAALVEDIDLPEEVDMSPGSEHTVTVIPFLFESDCALYRGCFIDETCTLACEELPCNPPVALELCQASYGEPAATAVEATWLNGEDLYPDGVLGYIDDLENPLGTLPGDAQAAVFSGIDVGEHIFALQGNCGDPFGVSSAAQQSFNVLAESPHTNPVEGQVSCEFLINDQEQGETTAHWTNADPSCYVDVYVRVGEDLFYVTTLPGSAETVTVVETPDPADPDPQLEQLDIVLRFFARSEAGCYASAAIECGGEEFFIRGLCVSPTGGNVVLPVSPNPQITNAIAIFNYLFLGAEQPVCVDACNVNGDDDLNITDGIHLLGFLFLGGPPPAGWIDQDGDSRADPTCEPITEGVDCETPLPLCPLET